MKIIILLFVICALTTVLSAPVPDDAKADDKPAEDTKGKTESEKSPDASAGDGSSGGKTCKDGYYVHFSRALDDDNSNFKFPEVTCIDVQLLDWTNLPPASPPPS